MSRKSAEIDIDIGKIPGKGLQNGEGGKYCYNDESTGEQVNVILDESPVNLSGYVTLTHIPTNGNTIGSIKYNNYRTGLSSIGTHTTVTVYYWSGDTDYTNPLIIQLVKLTDEKDKYYTTDKEEGSSQICSLFGQFSRCDQDTQITIDNLKKELDKLNCKKNGAHIVLISEKGSSGGNTYDCPGCNAKIMTIKYTYKDYFQTLHNFSESGSIRRFKDGEPEQTGFSLLKGISQVNVYWYPPEGKGKSKPLLIHLSDSSSSNIWYKRDKDPNNWTEVIEGEKPISPFGNNPKILELLQKISLTTINPRAVNHNSQEHSVPLTSNRSTNSTTSNSSSMPSSATKSLGTASIVDHGSWDSIIRDEADDAINFPALALKNDQNREELKEVEKSDELSEWAKELLEREKGYSIRTHENEYDHRKRVDHRDRRSRSKSYEASSRRREHRDYRNRRDDHRDKSDYGDRDHDRKDIHSHKGNYRREYRRERSDSRSRDKRRHRRDYSSSSSRSVESRSHKDKRYGDEYPNPESLEGSIFPGRVTNITDFGAFVSFKTPLGDREGLVHKSEISSTRRIIEVSQVLKRGISVYIKILKVIGEKFRLTMKDIDQTNGSEIKRVTETVHDDFYDNHKHSDYGTGEQSITGISVDEYTQGIEGRRKRLISDVEKWEQQQLLNSGILSKEEKKNIYIENEPTEEEPEIEISDACPTFLKGQTTRSGIMLSPIKIIANPEGSLARTITTSITLAKERKEMERENEDAVAPVNTSLRMHESLRNWRTPLAAKESTNQSIKDQRESLPVFQLRRDLLDKVREHHILIVIGETGSGKSTQIPQYLQEVGYSRVGMIGCTQPRRVAAKSVAARVAKEFGCNVGEEVGYCIRFDDCTSPSTCIKYMTDGMLLREVLQDPILEKYSAIMLDEAHERTIATDVLFALLKDCASKRPDFRLIVTSATLEAEKFSSYFFNCPIFTIPGRSFPVEILHVKEQEHDYLEASLQAVLHIHLNEGPGDILLFLTGQEDIEAACKILQQRMARLEEVKPPPLIVLPVYAALPSEVQHAIFEAAPPGCRKCIVATNIAEASITIDGIFFVVDPGFAKVKHYNARAGMESLAIVPISRANAQQRAGRAGRTGPGKCYRLYTEHAYHNEMISTPIPEIQRTNLSTVVLILKAMGINDFIHFDFMDKPPIETLIDAMENLYHLGALDDDGLLTRLGRKMAEFPMDPNMAKMLLSSIDLLCSDEIITIIAMLSVQNIFYRPRDKQAQADQARSKFIQSEGDHVTYLQLYSAWQRNKFSDHWCKEHFVQHGALRRAQDVRKQLISIMDRYRFKVVSAGKNFERISKAICSGFFHHSAKRDPQEGYRTVVDQQQVYIHPSSALHLRNPEYVVYHELVMTTKEYMRDLTVVKGQWLLDVAPSMFKKSDGSSIPKHKANFKIEPLHNKFQDKDAWRLSKRRG